MYRRVLAFDFDGTLAQNGVVPLTLQTALDQLRAAGYALFMVTSRHFESIAMGSLRDVFSGIVWENGAVLYHTATDEVFLPFGHIDLRLVQAIKLAEVPLEHGRASVSTRTPYTAKVWQVLNRWGGDAVVVHNKGTVRILPPGAAKGAGLERLLGLCGFSPRNLVSFGDGESDLSLLQLGEIGVAVADAVPSVKEVADLVTGLSGPAGVLEALQTYWLNGATGGTAIAQKRKRRIPLGEDEAGDAVYLPSSALSDGNLGVFGDSGSGKSWVAGLLAEGMHHAGYQVLLIDPEGDFRGLRALPGIVALEGDQRTLPLPELVASLLETAAVSVVLDLCSYPVADRGRYVTGLLRALRPLKERKFRPHWIVLEEAQHFLPPSANETSNALLPMLAGGGWALVSYRPDRLVGHVLAALDHCILTRLSEPEAIQAVRQKLNGVPEESLVALPQGHAWLCGQRAVRLRPNVRRVPHARHQYKYLDTPLPAHKRFYFCDEQGPLGIDAASLFEFSQCLHNLPVESLAFHQSRGDFVAWVEGTLGDQVLADHLRKLAQRPLEGEALRKALLQRVTAHYQELHALR